MMTPMLLFSDSAIEDPDFVRFEVELPLRGANGFERLPEYEPDEVVVFVGLVLGLVPMRLGYPYDRLDTS
jgi:hypothetical protein